MKIRFVVLKGGSNGYPLHAETFSEPPSAVAGAYGDVWEISEAHAAAIERIESQILDVKRVLAELQMERLTACEFAASRGERVRVSSKA